jgi:hypothetical protein
VVRGCRRGYVALLERWLHRFVSWGSCPAFKAATRWPGWGRPAEMLRMMDVLFPFAGDHGAQEDVEQVNARGPPAVEHLYQGPLARTGRRSSQVLCAWVTSSSDSPSPWMVVLCLGRPTSASPPLSRFRSVPPLPVGLVSAPLWRSLVWIVGSSGGRGPRGLW